MLNAEEAPESPEINDVRAPSVQLIIATTKTAMAGASHCQAGMGALDEARSSDGAAKLKIFALRAGDG